MTPHIVIVEWDDAFGRAVWMTVEDTVDLTIVPVTTVGFLLKEGPKELVIAATYSSQHEYSAEVVSEVLVIPRGCVKSIKRFDPKAKMLPYRRPRG